MQVTFGLCITVPFVFLTKFVDDTGLANTGFSKVSADYVLLGPKESQRLFEPVAALERTRVIADVTLRDTVAADGRYVLFALD